MSGKAVMPISVTLSPALSVGPINTDVGEVVPESVGWSVSIVGAGVSIGDVVGSAGDLVGGAVEGLSVGISVVGYVTGALVGFI